MVIAAPLSGKRVDVIVILDISQCVEIPSRLGEFPSNWFTISGYDKNPYIPIFSWAGDVLFALTGVYRNNGYGDFYIYNSDLHRADERINPINNACCYRDPSWSPDGSYLAFAYQELSETNRIQIYVIRYGDIGTGAKFTPIPLPEDFFPNRTESPQPILRRVINEN